jgi:hypothetical protein
MSPQVDMYKGQSLSPDYTLQIAINDTEAVITLNTLVGLVEPPGLLVLGADTEAPEVVRYTAPGVANQLFVERAVEGVANSWGSATLVRNQLTALGYNNIIDNIDDNATNVGTNATNIGTNTTDIPNAERLTAGTVNGARLPNATDTSKGAIKVRDDGAGTFYITSDGSTP